MKFMNMKRFGATVMAGVLSLSLAAPAFAATSTPAGQVIITGSYEDIPIAVEVPSTGTAQINPYGLPVEVKKTVGSVNITGQKITTQPLSIKNRGEVALNVTAGLTVTPKGDLAVVAVGTDLSSVTAKQATVELQVAALNHADYAVASTDVQLQNKLIDKFVDSATWSGLAADSKLGANAGTATTPGAESKTATGKRMATLGAATVGNGGIVTYGNDSIALFRLSGDVVAEPTTAWAAADGFEAKIVFKFTPAVTYAITVDSAITAAMGTVTFDKTTAQAGDTVTVTVVAASGKTLTGVTFENADGTGTAQNATIPSTPSTGSTDEATFTMARR